MLSFTYKSRSTGLFLKIFFIWKALSTFFHFFIQYLILILISRKVLSLLVLHFFFLVNLSIVLPRTKFIFRPFLNTLCLNRKIPSAKICSLNRLEIKNRLVIGTLYVSKTPNTVLESHFLFFLQSHGKFCI